MTGSISPYSGDRLGSAIPFKGGFLSRWFRGGVGQLNPVLLRLGRSLARLGSTQDYPGRCREGSQTNYGSR